MTSGNFYKYSTIIDYVRSFDSFCRSKKKKKNTPDINLMDFLQPLEISNHLWISISMDFTTDPSNF